MFEALPNLGPGVSRISVLSMAPQVGELAFRLAIRSDNSGRSLPLSESSVVGSDSWAFK